MTQSNVFHMGNIKTQHIISTTTTSLISMIMISKHGRKGKDKHKS